MTATSSLSRPLVVVLLGAGAIAGAGLASLILRGPSAAPPASPSDSVAAAAAVAPAPGASSAEPSVTLAADAMTRAGITLATVESAPLGGITTIPALIEPNAYKQTVVTALIGGRVTRVMAELGQRVRRGQPLAELYSPELADAQRAYISATATLGAHEQQLARTERLVAIGSASRQELEQAHAEHAMLTTTVEGARSRLELLGMTAAQVTGLSSASQIAATIEVRAPLDGIVTAREANVGLNVEGAAPLFTVIDLSTVWVVGDLYEQDIPRVRVGTPVTIGVSALPGLELRGVISYLDPQLGRDTRTAKVRAEVGNPNDRLRFGMYAQMRVASGAGDAVPVVPKTAVQTVGDRAVVYVSDPGVPGRFVERPIRTGTETADRIEVVSGVKVGDRVVAGGSFFVRAERERMGISGGGSSAPARVDGAADDRQTARVTVTDKGFDPDRLWLKAGVPAEITFLRTTDATCAKDVVFPSLNLRRELPLNVPVAIDLTPASGEIGFVCGMNMFRGSVTAQ